MKITNPLDEKLEAERRRIPTPLADSVRYVADTLDLCWAAAQTVFESRASPEHALAIYTLVAARLPSGTRTRKGTAKAG